MLKHIRGARVSLRTAVLVLALALLVWAIVVFVNVRDFVPAELETSGHSGL